MRPLHAGAAPPSASSAAATAPPASVHARFGSSRDLLFVLLPRELVVLDLELGVPAANQVSAPAEQRRVIVHTEQGASQGRGAGTPRMHALPQDGLCLTLFLPFSLQTLPGGPRQPAFSGIMAICGAGTCLGGGDEGGGDVVYCSHADGGMSVWMRCPGEKA